MKNKYKNRVIIEPYNTDINNKDNNLNLKSNINDFKDIITKKIVLKKKLTLENDINLEKDKNLLNSINNDLKKNKPAPLKKNHLYPQSKDLLSPKYKNLIQKTNIITDNPSINFLNAQIKKNDIIEDKENNNLFHTIQVQKKVSDNINSNENNFTDNYNNNSQFDKKMNSKYNKINYTKKKVIYHGKNNSIINKMPNITNIINKFNDDLNDENLMEKKIKQSIEKNNKIKNSNIINDNISDNINKEGNLNSFQLQNSFIIVPKKMDIKNNFDPIALENDKNNQIKKENKEILNNNIFNTDISLIKDDKCDQGIDIYNKMTHTINDNKKEEKKRYIYINHKFKGIQNYSKNNKKEDNFPKKKKIKIEILNKYSKNIENNTNENYSLTEKNEAINNINGNMKLIINTKFIKNHYKLKDNNNKKPFQSLKTLVHKVHEIEQYGDSFGNFYLNGPRSTKNKNFNSKIRFVKNENNNNDLSICNNALKTISNTYKKDNNFINKFQFYEDKNHFVKNNNNDENRIINNNTYNTTVNFYKISQICPDIDINPKNSDLSASSINSKKKYGHKRIISDNSLKSNRIAYILNMTQKKVNKDKDIQFKTENNKIISSYNNEKYIKTESLQGNDNKEFGIDLEILYILEAKLKCVLNKVNNYTICYNECFDWINYYFSCYFYEKEINLFKSTHNKNNIIYYIKVELLCYFLCYDVSFNKNFTQTGILLKTIFNLLHINYVILISFIIYNNIDNVNENNDNFFLNKIKDIINKELKFFSQDMNENSMLLLISNNFKDINNYYKMIIDNLYSYYYSINDNTHQSKFKFPKCLLLDVNSLSEVQKLNIISLFFFDAYRFSNNYNFEDLKIFFDLYLFKSKENEASISFNNININNKYLNSFNNNNYYKKYINEKKNYNNSLTNEYYLPPIKPYYKYTLVLDLDETLIYFQKDNIILNNSFNNNKNTLIFRPGLFDFLQKMKSLYELVLFSFGTKDYVDHILNIIEKKEKIFEYALYRHHATYEKGEYVKNLALLGRDLKKIIIVDDIPHVFKLQKANGICIKPFYGDIISDRNTLKLLGIILEKIRFDVEENDGDIRKSLSKLRNLIFTHITTNLEN